jgi:hypothetical protein
MGTKIEDGTGSGLEAGVNALNELYVVTETPWQKACRRGDAYLWQNVSADIATGETMILVRNDSSTRLLAIHGIYIGNGNVAATTYDIHYVTTAFTAAGTAVVGVNMNANFGAAVDVTAYADETGNTQGTVLMDYISIVAGKGDFLTAANASFLDGLVLAGGTALGIDQITESTAGVGGIYGYFIDP